MSVLPLATNEPSRAREMRRWWYALDGRVGQVDGFDCRPDNPEVWWCPSLGLSLIEGAHLFPAANLAFEKARAYIADERRKLDVLESLL
jgi:hypothetical protein